MIIPHRDLSFKQTCLEMARQNVPVVLKSPRTNTPLYPFRGVPAKTPDELEALIAESGSRAAGVCLPLNWCMFDFDEDADNQYRAFRDRFELDDGQIARSPSGNLHVWYMLPDGVKIINGTNKGEPVDVPGMDILNHKSLVTLPSSWRPANEKRGKCEGYYKWVKRPPETVCLPERVTSLLQPREHKHVQMPSVPFAGDVTPYARTCLDNAVKCVSESTENRNTTLNAESYNLGRVAGAGLIDPRQAKRALYVAAVRCGLESKTGKRAVIATIDSGFNAGLSRPLTQEVRRTYPCVKNSPNRRPRP